MHSGVIQDDKLIRNGFIVLSPNSRLALTSGKIVSNLINWPVKEA